MAITCTHSDHAFYNNAYIKRAGLACLLCERPVLGFSIIRLVCEATLRMKLQPGICPFPVLKFWHEKVKTPCHTPVPWHVAGIYRPLPVSRVLSEEPRKQGLVSFLAWLVAVQSSRVLHCRPGRSRTT